MNRKIVWLLISCLMVLLLLSGCGVAQEEHDAVVAERDAAQSELAATQDELTAKESNLASTESELAATQNDLAATQSDLVDTEDDLAAAQSRISSLQSDMAATESDLAAALDQVSQLGDFKSEAVSAWDLLCPKIELVNQIAEMFALLEAGEQTKFIAATFSLSGYVDDVKDSELSELWDQSLDSLDQEKWAQFDLKFADVIDKALELIGADIEAMEAQLAE